MGDLVAPAARQLLKPVARRPHPGSLPDEDRGDELAIRLAAAEDSEEVFEILRESFVEYRSRYTAAAYAATVPEPSKVLERLRQGPVWIARLEATPVGTVSAVESAEGVYLRGMAVVPSARAHGVGWRLLETVERFARERGAARLYLSSTPFLRQAISLYERFGFHRSAEGPHELVGTPLFTMEKRL